MKIIPKLFTAILFIIAIAGCQESPLDLISTPPPGWRTQVSNLFINESAFPKGWSIDFTDPEGKESDPTINHFFRGWSNLTPADARQHIYRGYSVADAKKLYDQLRISQFSINDTPFPGDVFSEYIPPKEVHFSSQIVDEYYFACGQWDGYNCIMLARYKNYVTIVHLSLMTTYNNDGGFTYPQMEVILENMDQRFVELFNLLK